MKSSGVQKKLSGWGRYPLVLSHCQRPEKWSMINQIIAEHSSNSILAYGAGRSYGDACLNASGQTVLMERMNRILSFNSKTGLLRCEAGVTIQEILETFVPKGWFPSVTPGTKFITIGGAIAFDVHGKNHHKDGSFVHFLKSFKIIIANGDSLTCSRTENEDLFWATVGGMGLTGIIKEAEIELKPIQTAFISCLNLKARNIYEAMQLFEEYEPQYDYSVAWIDCLANGKSLGRSILMFGNHATVQDVPPQNQANPLILRKVKPINISFDAPSFLLNRQTISVFNQLYFSKQIQSKKHFLSNYDQFFYPLDSFLNWNRLYGKRGFVQYQFSVPLQQAQDALTEVLQLSSEKGYASFLAVLKRMGQGVGMLSFPQQGYTLALDIPVKPGIWSFLEQLDQIILHYQGRVYLAKDARLGAESFRAMYPDYEKWINIKSKFDPHNYFRSALSERLEIQFQ